MQRWITPLLAATVVLLSAGFLFTDVGNRALIRRPPPPGPRAPALALPQLPAVSDAPDDAWPATAEGLSAAMADRADALAACLSGGDPLPVVFVLADDGHIARTEGGEGPAFDCVQDAVDDLEFAPFPGDEVRLRYTVSP